MLTSLLLRLPEGANFIAASLRPSGRDIKPGFSARAGRQSHEAASLQGQPNTPLGAISIFSKVCGESSDGSIRSIRPNGSICVRRYFRELLRPYVDELLAR
jgi:hypothetical protein